MLHSSYVDVYRGVRYEIKFFSLEKGFTAEIHLNGSCVYEDSESLWRRRDAAVISMVNEAHRIIEKLEL